ncbi:MAG: MarR family winged helix-turn-helix transcriptional regulator [Nostocoides sp.]
MTSAVPTWRSSPTLDALQTLIDVAGATPAAVARQAGLSTSELHALRHLSIQALGPAELARRLGVTSAAASGIVDRLVERGHAERRANPHDGRRAEVHLTDTGRSEMVRHLAPMFGALAALDADLDEADRQIIDTFLARATAAIRLLL